MAWGVKLVGRPILLAFVAAHADARASVQAWGAEVEAASWRGPNDIRQRYPSASFLSERRVIFNIKGNTYRLLVQVAFETQVVLIQRIGTHAEYDKWKV